MSTSIISTVLIITVLVICAAIYFAHFRNQPSDVFVPKAAWLWVVGLIFITPPATRAPGLFGLTRASGYFSADPENDPYMQAAHLPR